MEQITMFELLYNTYKIDKPIALIELFAGYGSQNLALKYLGANYRHHKIVEWAVKSIEAYNDIHIRDYKDYSKDLADNQLLDYLCDRGISMDYSNPMTKDQIAKKGVEWQRKVYNNIIATNNLVDINRVHAEDLEINKNGKECYIMTYSFPCQDLSLAGLGKGMARDSGTRSGLLWQVERILLECEKLNTMPDVLIMENVPDVKGSNNIKDFTAWVKQLQNLGYSNYCDILNAKEFGIPQNRRRCFMVSVLGEWNYKMPKTMRLKYKLKDLLEQDVEEKYFLSSNAIKGIMQTNFECQKLENRTEKNGVMATLCARDYKDPKLVVEENFNIGGERLKETLQKNDVEKGDFIDSYNRAVRKDIAGAITTRVDASNNTFVADTIRLGGLFDKGKDTHQAGSIYSANGTSPALDTATGGHRTPLVVDLKRGYSCEVKEENEDINGVDVIGNYSKSNFSQTPIVNKNGLAPTITENHGQVTAIAIKNATKEGYLMAEDGDGIDISGRMEYHRGTVQKGTSQTLTTGGSDVGVAVKVENENSFVQEKMQEFIEKNGYLPTYFNPYNSSEIIDVAPAQTTQCGGSTNSSTVLISEKIVRAGQFQPKDRDYNKKGDKREEQFELRQDDLANCILTGEKKNCVAIEDTEPRVIGGIGEKLSNGGTQYYQQNRIYDDNVAITCSTGFNPYYKAGLRIRKLTPRECFRLMGVKDEDSKKIK